MMDVQYIRYAAVGLAAVLFTANWWYPWLAGLFVRKQPAAVDLYPHVLALREALPATTYNAVLTEVCGKPESIPNPTWDSRMWQVNATVPQEAKP